MKHLFLFLCILTLTCILQPLYPSMSAPQQNRPNSGQSKHVNYKAARKRMRKAHNSIFKSIVLPRTAPRSFEDKMNVFTIVLTGLAQGCDWLQPLQTRTAYLDACKSSAQAKWRLLYSATWWVKKILACNKIYRVGSRMHQKPHDIFGCIISVCQMLSIGGDSVADPEHLQLASEKIWGDRFKSWGSGNQ